MSIAAKRQVPNRQPTQRQQDSSYDNDSNSAGDPTTVRELSDGMVRVPQVDICLSSSTSQLTAKVPVVDNMNITGAQHSGNPQGDDVPRGKSDIGAPDLDQQETHWRM